MECYLCKHQSDDPDALVNHIRSHHFPSTLKFERVESAMRGVSEKYRYEVVGLQNNLNLVFNNIMINEIIAFVATRLVTHPSYKIKLVLGALYEKSATEFDRKDLTPAYFPSIPIMIARPSLSSLKNILKNQFMDISNKMQEFCDNASGLYLVDILSIDLDLDQNILYTTQ